MELMQASHEWATRPPDERFWDLKEMLTATVGHMNNSAVGDCRLERLTFKTVETAKGGPELVLKGESKAATIGHYAFGQISRLLGAPANYLRTLPSELVAKNLNHGVAQYEDKNRVMSLLLRKGDVPHVRAALSEDYTRIWNCQIVNQMQPLTRQGWRVPPARPAGQDDPRARPARKEDLTILRGALSVKEGDMISPAGLYASEKDMFAFMINEQNPIEVSGKPLGRGFFLENSEVGDRAFKVTTFLYNYTCGNHIVWGVSDVKSMRVVHRGKASDKAFGSMQIQLREYAETSANELQGKIKKAQDFYLTNKGGAKAVVDDVIEFLIGKRVPLSAQQIGDAFTAALKHPQDHGDCSPASAWGFAQGLSRISQDSDYADARVEIDRAAGKIVTMAF